uniref:Myb-like domain-containing protein n=1 Tax=Brassica oleracea var. oleracea TaxID=109376 RepID=A0A0D3D083_BRAOL
MDSRNIPSQSSSYVGLLNQQGSVLHGNFPYESYHLSVHYPPFSSQQSEAPPLSEETPVDRKERKKWSPADDEVLISAWLNTSKDAIVGNDQNKGTFWKRVGEYYAGTPHGQKDGERREHLHCKQRWHRINDLTNKFCGAVAAAERQVSSGQNDTYVLKMAHDIFYADHNIKFNASPSSKRKNVETGSQASNTHVAGEEIRPEGVKAAKSKRNAGKEKSLADYTSIWEMKQVDLATKERLSKLAILDTLLARKEPLTEAEELCFMEEMRARDSHVLQLAEKVDSLTILPDYETEQRMDRLEKIVRDKESVRKDVERAFGVLQSRFAVVKNPSNLWDKSKIGNIMRDCLILHNMIVEDERDSDTIEEFEEEDQTFVVKKTKKHGNTIGRRKEVRDPNIHLQLKEDLIENIWQKFGYLPF